MSCKYCMEDRNGYINPLDKNCHVRISNGVEPTLEVSYQTHNISIPIKFCPKCGRKLGVFNDKPIEPLNQRYNPVNFETVGNCPNCGAQVCDSIGGRQEVCKCGQKLKWE